MSDNSLSFRWKYILLPLAILVLSLVLVGVFSRGLPPEVAYHFQDGTPDRWIGRAAIIIWTIVPQFVFMILGVIIIFLAVMLARRIGLGENKPTIKLLSVMGNMVALPQLIIFFAMLEIFLYNSYQIHLIPLWMFALIVMILGIIALGIFFTQALREFRGQAVKTTGSNTND